MTLIPRFSPMNSLTNMKSIFDGVKKWRVSMNQKKEKFDKRIFKKSPEELEQYMQFKRRGSRVESKKGKGSFKRHSKHKNQDFRNCA